MQVKRDSRKGTGLYISFFVLVIASIVGCTSAEDVEETAEAAKPLVAETQTGDFLLRLVSIKENYEEGEDVEITAKLKYIGDQEEVRILHSSSPFWYRIQEVTRGIEIPYFMEDPSLETTLKRDVWYEEKYLKTGGYRDGEDEESKEFVQSFVESDDFPEGEYEIELNSDFYLVNEDGEDQKQHVSTGIIITVER